MNQKHLLLTLPVNAARKAMATWLIAAGTFGCHGQTSQGVSVETTVKTAPESLHFRAHITENKADGSKSEIDTTTGYRKYYYAGGMIQMEGRVVKGTPKDYRIGVWKYYNEKGQLVNQETYTKEGKINQLDFIYFTTGQPMRSTYQYYEGDYRDKSTFRFHKLEKLYYKNGKKLAERHWVNDNLLDEKCWDARGNLKPIAYLNTIKSLDGDQ